MVVTPLERCVADFLSSEDGPIASAINKLDFYLDDFHVDPEGFPGDRQ